MSDYAGQAVIEGGCIVIRVPIANLPTEQPKIPKLPMAVEDFADTVLRYRPKPKSDAAKKRKKRIVKSKRS